MKRQSVVLVASLAVLLVPGGLSNASSARTYSVEHLPSATVATAPSLSPTSGWFGLFASFVDPFGGGSVAPDPTDPVAPVDPGGPVDLDGPFRDWWVGDEDHELIERRDAYTKTYANPDDPLELNSKIASAPLHFQNEDGDWVDIDTSFRRLPDGRIAARDHYFHTTLPDRVTDTPMTEIRMDGHVVTYSEGMGLLARDSFGYEWPLATLDNNARARLMENVALYPNALGGDLVYRLSYSAVEQQLILHQAPSGLLQAPEGELVFRETMTFSDGLEPFVEGEHLAAGTINGLTIEFQNADGLVVFQALAPSAYESDSIGETNRRNHVPGYYVVTRADNALVVDKVMPAEWFLAPEREYPVVVDPTLTPTFGVLNQRYHTGMVWRCHQCTYDTRRDSGSPHPQVYPAEYERILDYGSQYYASWAGNSLRVMTNSNTRRQMRAWIRFNTSGIQRYISNVDMNLLEGDTPRGLHIHMNLVPTLPSQANALRLKDANFDPCDYDASAGFGNLNARGQALYNGILNGVIYLATAMGRECEPNPGGEIDPGGIPSPHHPTDVRVCMQGWHQVSVCGGGGANLQSRRASNIDYFNLGLEFRYTDQNADFRFADRHTNNRPYMRVRYTVECTTDSHCRDGLPSCRTDWCDSGRCVERIHSGYCLIGGSCYSNGTVDPNNQCRRCNVSASQTSWTNDNSLPCSDGDPCTHSDQCLNGSCVGVPYTCDDGLACTENICDGIGGCNHPLISGNCLIDGVCYSRGTYNPDNPCQQCLDNWGRPYRFNWAYDNSAQCELDDPCMGNHRCHEGTCIGDGYDCDDGLFCTINECTPDGEYGTCTTSIDPGTCYIGGACYNNNQTSPYNECQHCNIHGSGGNTDWTNKEYGAGCGSDGLTCTDDICNGSGLCIHPIKDGHCMIGGVCRTEGEEHPTNPCMVCNPEVAKTDWTPVPNHTVSADCYSPPHGPCEESMPGIGICRSGTMWCTNGEWGPCSGMQCPEPERCDYLDNNCNGNTDELWPEVANGAITPCDGGDPDECRDGYYTCRPDGTDIECVNDGAIAFFKFEEGTGATTTTSSGPVWAEEGWGVGQIHGANWTNNGYERHNYDTTPTSYFTTRALVFDGASSRVEVPYHPTMEVGNQVSMEAMVYPTSTSGAWRIIGGRYDQASNAGFYMAVNYDQGPGLSVWTGACGWKYSNTQEVPPLNQSMRDRWTHVAFTYDGASIRIFMNGWKVAQHACSGEVGDTTAPLMIGGFGPTVPGQQSWLGRIDNFAVYDRALSDSEVAARANFGNHCDGTDNDCSGLIDPHKYFDPYTARLMGPNPPMVCPQGPLSAWAFLGDPCDGDDIDCCKNGTYTCHSSGLFIECVNEDPTDLVQVCDGIDNNCDGHLLDDEVDEDGDGWMICEGDCDDTNPLIYPGARELCDGFDNNCTGELHYQERDHDGDGYLACVRGEPILTELAHDEGRDEEPPRPEDLLYPDPLDWEDCDDYDPRVYKGHAQFCDFRDNNCSGLTDDDDPAVLMIAVDSHTPLGTVAGATLNVEFYGRNFVRQVPVTAVDFGYGVTVNEITVHNSSHFTANITVKEVEDDEGELYSTRDLVISSGYCEVVRRGGFAVVDPEFIPTLGQWGLVLLSVLLLGLGVFIIRRRGLVAAA